MTYRRLQHRELATAADGLGLRVTPGCEVIHGSSPVGPPSRDQIMARRGNALRDPRPQTQNQPAGHVDLPDDGQRTGFDSPAPPPSLRPGRWQWPADRVPAMLRTRRLLRGERPRALFPGHRPDRPRRRGSLPAPARSAARRAGAAAGVGRLDPGWRRRDDLRAYTGQVASLKAHYATAPAAFKAEAHACGPCAAGSLS